MVSLPTLALTNRQLDKAPSMSGFRHLRCGGNRRLLRFDPVSFPEPGIGGCNGPHAGGSPVGTESIQPSLQLLRLRLRQFRPHRDQVPFFVALHDEIKRHRSLQWPCRDRRF